MTDCEHLYESSQYIKHWIQQQPGVKEESLTDWLLFDVSEKIPSISYKAFSRHEEARQTGADWEWWFLYPSFSFAMRVQAKKLHPSSDNYPGIAHTNRHGLQIEKLLRDCARENYMPFYAFYTDQRADVMCQMQRNDEGVFMAGGQKIYDAFMNGPRLKVMTADALQHTVALSCFLCCPLASGRESLMPGGPGDAADWDGWKSFINQYYRSETEPMFTEKESNTANEMIPGMHKKTPPHIESFVKLSREGLPDWWEREFRHAVEGTNALVVYDLRERSSKH
jgi:hypothetical protein